MEIRIRKTGQVMFEGEFRAHLLATGGPSYDTLTADVAEALGVDVVFEGPQAVPTTPYQTSQRSGVEQGSDGKWYTKYILGPVFTAYTDDQGVQHSVASQKAAYKAAIDTAQWASVRARRNATIAACDWTQLADAPVDDLVWATYRQALRDLPEIGRAHV